MEACHECKNYDASYISQESDENLKVSHIGKNKLQGNYDRFPQFKMLEILADALAVDNLGLYARKG